MGLSFKHAKFNSPGDLETRLNNVRAKWCTQGSVDGAGNVVLDENFVFNVGEADLVIKLVIKVNNTEYTVSRTISAAVECAEDDLTELLAVLNALDWNVAGSSGNDVVFTATDLVLTVTTTRYDDKQAVTVHADTHASYGVGANEGSEGAGTANAAWSDALVQAGYDGSAWTATWWEPTG